MTKHVNIQNARSENQIQALEKIEQGDFCPFCKKDYIQNEHKKPIIEEGKYWLATENRWPYKGSSSHILLIHKKHLEKLDEISNPAWLELKEMVDNLTKKLVLHGFTLVLRTGDSKYTGGTVKHLHAQLISGDPRNKEPVLARVG